MFRLLLGKPFRHVAHEPRGDLASRKLRPFQKLHARPGADRAHELRPACLKCAEYRMQLFRFAMTHGSLLPIGPSWLRYPNFLFDLLQLATFGFRHHQHYPNQLQHHHKTEESKHIGRCQVRYPRWKECGQQCSENPMCKTAERLPLSSMWFGKISAMLTHGIIVPRPFRSTRRLEASVSSLDLKQIALNPIQKLDT